MFSLWSSDKKKWLNGRVQSLDFHCETKQKHVKTLWQKGNAERIFESSAAVFFYSSVLSDKKVCSRFIHLLLNLEFK